MNTRDTQPTQKAADAALSQHDTSTQYEPAPQAGMTAPHGDTPAPQAGAPVPHGDTPAPQAGMTAPHGDTPATPEQSATPQQALIDLLRRNKLTIATAESLTGGGLCSRLVDVPGASDVLHGGICTYSSQQKNALLNVPQTTLDEHGPVHADVAAAMARGAQHIFHTDVAIATTGVAGPGPADGHPAGTVYIACATGHHIDVILCHFNGDRSDVREHTIHAALTHAHHTITRTNPTKQPTQHPHTDTTTQKFQA